jgi:peptidoglycan/LPS O-acetylase OafA/YrhL
MKRLLWIDVAKGLAICFVVYFHFFRTVFEYYEPPPADWSSAIAGTISFLRGAWWEISGLGFHAVGAFIILSGWTLMESTVRHAQLGELRWSGWYRARFIRLYPMYWVAHIVYFVSPFVARLEPIDGRLVLSLLGLRFINIEMNFMYLNAAWWYFSMLIQFYLIFPLLYWAVQKWGTWTFLIAACALGFFVRYLMLVVWPQNGLWVLGGLAICRLPEFALGMALAAWHSKPALKHPSESNGSTNPADWFLLRGVGLVTGVILYPLALQLYDNGIAYVFCDFGTGTCCFLVIVGLAGIISRFAGFAKILGIVGIYSYGLYLVHQPYVIWLGLKIRPQPVFAFLFIFLITLAILSAWGTILEKGTNGLVNRILAKRKAWAS